MFHQFLAILFCEGSKGTNAAVNMMSPHKVFFCALMFSTDWLQCHVFRLQNKIRKCCLPNNLEVTERLISTLKTRSMQKHNRKDTLSARDMLPKTARLETIHNFWWWFEAFESEKIRWSSSSSSLCPSLFWFFFSNGAFAWTRYSMADTRQYWQHLAYYCQVQYGSSA